MLFFETKRQKGEKFSSKILDAVEAEQVDLAYRNMQLSSLAVLLNSLIFTWTFWGIGDNRLLLAWGCSQLLVILGRGWQCRMYRYHPQRKTPREWKNIFLIGVILSALIWGISPILFFSMNTPLHQSVLMIVLAGMSAGAVSSLSSISYAAGIYVTLLILPLVAVLILQGDILYAMLALTITLYWILLLVVAHRTYENITNALQSRLMYEYSLTELKRNEEHFEMIFKEAPAGIFYYDTDFIIIDSNSEMLRILNIDAKKMIGLDLKNLPDTSLNDALSAPLRGKKGEYEGPYTTMVNKLNLWIVLQTSPMFDTDHTIIGGVGIVTDITERVVIEEKMKHQAYYDALTDIPNRVLLKDRIVQSLVHYRRHRSLVAVLFLDLDHFKNINDSLGHHIGDALLIETAKRLVSVCREGDTVARLGGDEFVILLEELGTEPHGAAARAELVAEKVHEILNIPFDVGLSEPIITSSSVGISLVNSDEQTVDDLLKFADTAMYQAKKEGRNTTRFYQEQMDQWIKKRIFLENGLRHAIENGELELYYQPVIDIASQKIVGAEALLRWNHPELGIVMPDDMIAIAEESGLIVPIGEWVLREACMQFVRWRSQQTSHVHLQRIAVNVSAVQFRQKDFVDRVIRIVAQTRIVPYMLELELTESTVIDKIDTVIDKMNRLRGAGISISMDDFGTGYSSLAYLKRLPFTTLKIDKSFVRDIMSDKDDAALVETILSIAAIFHLEVIAEGVEEVEQYEFLREHQCQYFQGYLCSKPIQVGSFEELLSQDILRCQTLH
ncbi:MAG: EAL domain-containing protein [Campylobacterales bacterium]|nr:EAL domain-containing protein [Campylobacterales bacterium]